MGSKFHVLAVDDSVIDRKLIERPLKASSYQVTVVDSGNKALEYLGLIREQQDPTYRDQVAVNHVITDYFMPGMTGHELLRKIKESRSCKDMPVVIMSSEDVPSRISRCLKDGGRRVLSQTSQIVRCEQAQAFFVERKIKGKVSRRGRRLPIAEWYPDLSRVEEPNP